MQRSGQAKPTIHSTVSELKFVPHGDDYKAEVNVSNAKLEKITVSVPIVDRTEEVSLDISLILTLTLS